MKRLVVLISVLMICVCFANSFACVQPEISDDHKHNYVLYMSDETHHWSKCDCGFISNVSMHIWTNSTCAKRSTCDVCGRERGQLLAHDFTNSFQSTDDSHWRVCKWCKLTQKEDNHILNENGICETCYRPLVETEGVVYDIYDNGQSASVVDYVGTAKSVRIADTYKGIPVKKVYAEIFDTEEFDCVLFPENAISVTSGSVTALQGKTIVNFGDSIFGNYRAPKDISTYLASVTGATVFNCGFGGCRMAKHSIANFDAFSMYQLATAIVSDDFSLQENAIEKGKMAETEGQGKLPSYFENSLNLLKSIDFSEVDIITIAYGTNDFTGSRPLDNTENQYDVESFCGALRYSIETMLNKYPHLKICLCTPMYRCWFDGNGEFVEDSATKINYYGNKLTEYVEKTIQVADKYNLYCIDDYNMAISKETIGVYFSKTDGTHPNERGRQVAARHIANEIISQLQLQD